MTIEHGLMLLGGLALFLYGMKMMSDGLELIAGNKMQMILEKLTANRFIGVFVGAMITAIIQSSSATTVMVVGFVNSGLMKLSQAVWVIMGANIGTTITGQLIALDVGMIAPALAIIGVIMASFFKDKRTTYLGEIIAGAGILFIGMGMMSDAMSPLRNDPQFISLMTTFSNPFIGIAVGTIFTAIIQSSSASVGILQSLAASGLIGLHSSAYILFGQNIGTCVTAFLASISANRNAKRATLVHVLFNVIGTIIFVVIVQFTPLLDYMISLTPLEPMKQIANLHTLFNLVTTLALLPFGLKLAEFTKVLLPIRDYEKKQKMEMVFFDEGNMGTFAIAFASLRQEVYRMFEITKNNLSMTIDAFTSKSILDFEQVDKNEDMINFLNYEITKYMGQVSGMTMLQEDSVKCNSLFRITSDIERIGDHTYNVAQYCKMMNDNQVSFDEMMLEELRTMYETIQKSLVYLDDVSFNVNREVYNSIEQDEQMIDTLTYQYRQGLIEQMKDNRCDARSCVTYSEILTDLERISDHILNIAQECRDSKFTLHVSIPALDA